MRQKRLVFLGHVVLLYLFTLLGTAAKDPVLLATGKHSLWQVRSGTNVLFLLGAIHFLKAESYPLAKPIEDAFEGAHAVAFETDLDALKDPQTSLAMVALGAAPGGKQLSELVSPQLYARVEKAAEGFEIPIEIFAAMRPWMAAVTLTALDLQHQGFDPEFGVDRHFYNRAKKAGKKIVPLETVDDQLGLFKELNGSEDSAFLKQTLDEMESLKSLMTQMVTAWKNGDSQSLGSLMHESLIEHPKLYQRLLIDRNRKWVPAIERLLKDSNGAVVIVGAGHLVGKESVVDLLRAKGFPVLQQ